MITKKVAMLISEGNSSEVMGSILYCFIVIKKGEINMSRYTGPSWKVSRRLGYSNIEKGV